MKAKIYKQAWYTLFSNGHIYPSPHSRRDIESCISAKHEGDEEVLFPTQLRPAYMTHPHYTTHDRNPKNLDHFPDDLKGLTEPSQVNWRFRVPDGRVVSFVDERYRPQSFTCGEHFGIYIYIYIYIYNIISKRIH